jgi:hypothetical protein
VQYASVAEIAMRRQRDTGQPRADVRLSAAANNEASRSMRADQLLDEGDMAGAKS